MEPAPRRAVERPYLLAAAVVVAALGAGAIAALAATNDPSSAIVGLAGFHEARDATCVDCHVPFLGTPASRCLSPGCHGALATGAPPRDGPAMPVRFHVALRGAPCSGCHHEHASPGVVASPRFTHGAIPADVAAECRRCHSARQQPDHARTDDVGCARCHGTERWSGTTIDHARVAEVACDVCHVAPEGRAHASLAGTCATCHGTDRWGTIALGGSTAK